MNYYYYLKVSANVSPSLVPNLLSLKQEIVKFEQKRTKHDCKYFVNHYGLRREFYQDLACRVSWDEPGTYH